MLRFLNEIKRNQVKWRGVLFTLVVIAFIELLKDFGLLPGVNPGPLYLLAISYTAFNGGLRAGLFSVLICFIYDLLLLQSTPPLGSFSKEQLVRLGVLVLSGFFTAFMMGRLRSELTRTLEEKTKQEFDNLNQEHFSRLFNSSMVGIFVGGGGKVSSVNEAFLEIIGYSHEDFEKGLISWESLTPLEYKEFDHLGVAEAKQKGYCTPYEKVYLKKDGRQVPILIGYSLLPNEPENFVCFVLDLTGKKKAETDLGQSKQQLEVILASITDGISVQDVSGKLVYVNSTAAKLTGFESISEMLTANSEQLFTKFKIFDEQGKSFQWDQLPGRRVIKGEPCPEIIIKYYLEDLHQVRWCLVKAIPIKDDMGNVVMSVNIFRDITKQKYEEDVLKRTVKRQSFLSRTGGVFESSLDYRTALSSVVALAVPDFADWATVDMLEENGAIKKLAVAHENPHKVRCVYELHEKYPPSMEDSTGLAKVLKTGSVEYYYKISDEMLAQTAKDRQQLVIMRELGLSSVIIVPMVVLGKTIGAITFVAGDSKAHFDSDDLAIAEELGRRASIAVQNTMLYEQSQDTAKREHEQTEILESFLSTAPIGFALVGTDMKYRKVNKELSVMLGRKAEDIIGSAVGALENMISSSLKEGVAYVLETREVVLNEEVSGYLSHDPGRARHWLVSYFPVFQGNNNLIGVGMVVDDVTRRKKAEDEISYRATHDILTGLPNRKAFEERLMFLIDQGNRENLRVAVMFLDLDRFKNINDTLGHGIGDQIMIEVAKRLKTTLGSAGLVARWGGDEFVILLENIKGDYEATRVASNILKILEESARIENHTLHIGTSIGISLFPQDGQTLQDLLKNADTALYRAKEWGRNRYEFYQEDMNFKASERLQMENELRQALQNNQMMLYYQPIVDIKTNRILGTEALIRWQHPTKGIIKPNQFITLAEESGQIVSIGKWVLREGCRQNQAWHMTGFGNLILSVNLSARQFMEVDLVPSIKEALSESGLDPRCLELEITESVAMENTDRTKYKLKELSALGIKITIDDFGTGYSSLSYLKSFPVTKLKIDKSFVRHSITNEQDSKIIRAIISMADSLSLKVVAEGVDTEMQKNLLSSLGCDAVQGYLISKPLPGPAMTVWLGEKVKAVPLPVLAFMEQPEILAEHPVRSDVPAEG